MPKRIPVKEFVAFSVFMATAKEEAHLDISDMLVEGDYEPECEYVPGVKRSDECDEWIEIDWEALKAFPTIEDWAIAASNVGTWCGSDSDSPAGYNQ